MKSKDLLSQLSDLEAKLSNFSFDELTTADASQLKKSFLNFKSSLEDKVMEQISPSLTISKNEDYFRKLHKSKDSVQKVITKNDSGQKEGMLIARVSHEIRTPLNGIIGFTDLLKEEGELNKKQVSHLNAIQSASHTLLDIINELLEYSKLSAGLEHFESVNFNFYSIVRDVMYLCNTLIVDKNVKLEVDLDTNIPEILVGDPSKLSQILLNVLGNAIKFVEKGDIHLKIMQLEQNGDEFVLEFDITDTGIGISEDNLKHIFDSFKQAELGTYAKYGGSGLGLSIVKQIIEKLDGQIKVESNLGIGTTFKFTLPYKKGNGTKILKGKINRNQLEGSRELVKGMRILVFEDNVLNQKLIEQRLKIWGCITYITDNPLNGLAILENKRVDMVLMDLRMPKMDGFEVTKRIRKSKNVYVREIPIIALTADFTIKDKDQCNVNGINDYILKPYSPDELLSKLLKSKNNMETIHAIESNTIRPRTNKIDKSPKIDLANILEECMGEVGLLEELVTLYKQNALEFIGQAKLHLKNTDFNQLEFATHKIKAGLAMMQTFSLHKIVEQMNKLCKTDKDIKHLEFLYDCFLVEYPIVETSINMELENIRRNRKQ